MRKSRTLSLQAGAKRSADSLKAQEVISGFLDRYREVSDYLGGMLNIISGLLRCSGF
ncbi:MAG: hypothetical protein R2865_14260 [Deinococcales bacterium]